MTSPQQRWPKALGLLLSLALGLLLATLALIPVLLGGGQFKEGPYCSDWGIRQERDLSLSGNEAEFRYEEGELSGFPPSQSCKVYEANRQGIASATPFHHLVAEGAYPEPSDYTWVLIALLAPSAIWCLYVIVARARRRRGDPDAP